MDNKSKHVKLYEGSMITLRALEKYLDENKIPLLIKDIAESARLSGFGFNESANELYVYEEDLVKSKEILKSFLKE